MTRTLAAVLVLVAVAACDDGKAKVEAAAQKVDHAVDKLDRDEAAGHLATARAALAANTDPAEACTWVASHPTATELARLCSFDVPMRHATMAVTAAEKARAEMPAAPSLTECSSDGWPAAKRALDRDHPGEPAWTALVARWATVCPGA
jgi:hypothetical protein